MLVALLSVSACAGTQKIDLSVSPKAELPRPPEKAALPAPPAINERPLKFVVVTLPNGKVYLALTPEQYSIYETNRAEVRRWVREARWQLRYYTAPPLPPEHPPEAPTGAKEK